MFFNFYFWQNSEKKWSKNSNSAKKYNKSAPNVFRHPASKSRNPFVKKLKALGGVLTFVKKKYSISENDETTIIAHINIDNSVRRSLIYVNTEPKGGLTIELINIETLS